MSTGADPNSDEKFKPLHIAIRRRSVALFNVLLNGGASKTVQDHGQTPIELVRDELIKSVSLQSFGRGRIPHLPGREVESNADLTEMYIKLGGSPR